VAQGKSLEQEISTRCPSRSDRSTPPDDSSHSLVECWPATPTSMIFGRRNIGEAQRLRRFAITVMSGAAHRRCDQGSRWHRPESHKGSPLTGGR